MAAVKPQTWTIRAVLQWATDDFRSRGIENPQLDAQVLLVAAQPAAGTNRHARVPGASPVGVQSGVCELERGRNREGTVAGL